MENSFLDAVLELPFVKRYKELKRVINENEEIKKKYNNLLELQKDLIKYKDPGLESLYYSVYYDLLDYPFMEEYFELVAEIESFLSTVKNIIEMEL